MLILLLIVLGLVFGSFVTEFSYRFPKKIPFAYGRSFCDTCGHKLSWKENIPLISFLLLSGKCKFCGKKISFRYPFIETSVALGFFIVYTAFAGCSFFSGSSTGSICWWKGNIGGFALPFALFIFLVILTVSIIDLEHQIIPDELVFIPYFMAIAILILIHPDNFYGFLFSGYFASLMLLTLNFITRGRGMGLGDVKFVLLGGTLLGFPLSIFWLIAAFIIGAAVGLFLIAIGKGKFGRRISFGPYLAVSFLTTFLYGPDILKMLGMV